MKNKRGQFTDVLLFVVLAFVFLLVSGLFIYFGTTIKTHLVSELEQQSTPELNMSEIAEQTVGSVADSYRTLYWGSVLIIVGMILGIFIGSWLVTANPLWFVPWIFVVFIVFTISVSISNAYETIRLTPELAETFNGFVAGNFLMGYLPIIVVVLTFTQALIMIIAWGIKRKNDYVY